MKFTIILIACVVLLVLKVQAAPQEKEYYPEDDDDFDVEEVLHNKRLFNFYANCFKTGQNCPPEAKRVRELIPQILKDGCARCSPKQKEKGKVVADFILKDHPEIFLDFEKKYDPRRFYRRKYADRLKAEGIILPD